MPEPALPGASLPKPASVISPELAGLGWMMTANVLFAVMTVGARLASRSAAWTTVGASRALLGALVALAFAWTRGAPLRTRRRGLSWARSLLGTLSMVCTFYALSSRSLAVGDAVTLFALAPLFIALLSPRFLGERPERSLWFILLLSFTGVAVLAGPQLRAAGLPAGLAILAAGFSALAMMCLRLMRSGAHNEPAESTEAIALHFALVAFGVLALLQLLWFRVPTPVDAGFLLLTGLSGGLAQLAMTRAYALTEAARLGAVSYLGTVLGFLFAIVFLDEHPGLHQILGATMVVSAGGTLAYAAAQRARASAAR